MSDPLDEAGRVPVVLLADADDELVDTQGGADDEPAAQSIVRLLFRVPTDDPVEAVNTMIEQINEHGLRTWTYRVENVETEEVVHIDGYGNDASQKGGGDTG